MIDLKEGAPQKIDCKLIPMTPGEVKVLRTFLEEQTKKGCICERDVISEALPSLIVPLHYTFYVVWKVI